MIGFTRSSSGSCDRAICAGAITAAHKSAAARAISALSFTYFIPGPPGRIFAGPTIQRQRPRVLSGLYQTCKKMSRKAAGRIYNFLHFNPPDGIYFSSGMKIRIKGPIGLSSAAKFILFAVAAVLVPTLILSVVQYRSLSDLQVKTEAAVEENLRRTLQSIVAQGRRYVSRDGRRRARKRPTFRLFRKRAEESRTAFRPCA